LFLGVACFTFCVPLLADLFLYSYQSEFLQKVVKDKKIHEARAFNFTYRYIDDVLSIINSRFAEFLPLIYPPELEVKENTDTASSASFLDLYLEFDDSGQLSTKIYDKRDDFNFKIINFPNMCSNIPAFPAYGVYPNSEQSYKGKVKTHNYTNKQNQSTTGKCIAYNRFCRDGIYFDKILVSEYKLFKRSNKANLFIALVQ
jgi:hypothetical protein